MPLQATSGAASYDGFGGGVAVVPTYIEDVFSTYLYTGNGSTGQTITNGIDLSTKGGLVWGKCRNNSTDNSLVDTVRGNESIIYSNLTQAADTPIANTISFLSTGFSVKNNIYNANGQTYASWTFREQPKFFDVVTYTGTGSNTTIAHSLGSVPGSIIVKRTDTTAAWAVYHRSLANTQYLVLNTTAAAATGATYWNSTTPTSTVFSLGTDASVNASGGTYVAYLFAHDAGGFGLTGTDNVISCGGFTSAGPSTDVTVTLGYEPQWIMVKDSSVSADWEMYDVMRGMSNTNTAILKANKSDAETNTTIAYFPRPTATGFIAKNSLGADAGNNIIYIAIRRGPMQVPTLGTSVYNAVVRTGTRAVANLTGLGFTPDTAFVFDRNAQSADSWFDRLRGVGIRLRPHDTGAEQTFSDTVTAFNMDGISYGADATANSVNYSLTSNAYINWFFRRAPGFFDEVCDSGTGGTKTITHNLGVAPELWFRKRRDSATYGNWYTYTSALGNTKYLILETTAAQATATADVWNLTTPTATTLYVGGDINLLGGGAATYVNYLFATCAGVSKVGSYTGTATTKQIDCGFTGGARFVLIKRTDSTGDWYVWDSARGIVAGNDPYLLLNSTAAEVTSTDYVDTYSAGFEISSTAPAAINASGGSFIFLAIA